jgi:RNA polymerase sigma-70 factor (ECF subfamily)
MMAALSVWVQRGRPDDAAAWLRRVAHNHVLDALRRTAGRERILARQEAAEPTEPDGAHTPPPLGGDVHDDLLRMLFVCCDEAVPAESRLVLSLKTLCGFGTGEIALRLFTSEANVHKRLARARDRLRELGRGTETPPLEALRARLPSVHEVLYLLFNEGYLSAQPDEAIRRELCDEAIRLCTVLADHAVGATPDTLALLALMHFHCARLASRLDRFGRLVLLEEQDRGLWDREMTGGGAGDPRRPGAARLAAGLLPVGRRARRAPSPRRATGDRPAPCRACARQRADGCRAGAPATAPRCARPTCLSASRRSAHLSERLEALSPPVGK